MHRYRFTSTGGVFPGAFVSLLKPDAALVHYPSHTGDPALANNHLAEHITGVVSAIAAAAAAAEAWWAANVNMTYRLNGGNECLLHFRNTSAFSGGTFVAGTAVWGSTGQVDGTRFTQPRWETNWNVGKYDVNVLPGGNGWVRAAKFGNNTDRKNVIDHIFKMTGARLDSRYMTW